MKDHGSAELIARYFPGDYIDVHSTKVARGRTISPGEFCEMAFGQLPLWIRYLLKLRNAIVKPLGLDTKSRFTDMICHENSEEVVFGMPDKHLTFYVSMICQECKDGKQELKITTVVKYNNTLGKIYFFIIRPFHSLIVRSILRNCPNLCK